MRRRLIPAYWKELAHIFYLEKKAAFLSWWTGRRYGFRRQVEIPNPLHSWPRNSPCFCGSGTKFKKCCRTSTPPYCLRTLALEAEILMAAAKAKGLI